MRILILQSTNLNYTKFGVINVSTTNFFWVNCKLPVDYDTVTGSFGPRVITDDRNVVCTYSGMTVGITAQQIASNVNSSAGGGYFLGDVPGLPLTVVTTFVNIACKLPAGATLGGIGWN